MPKGEENEKKTVYPLLRRCPLFSGMEDGPLSRALTRLNAHSRSYQRGELLHRAGEPLRFFGLVLSGAVQVYADDLEGNQMMMANVEPGGTFGDSLAFLAAPAAPVYIQTQTRTEVLWLDPSPFRCTAAEMSEEVHALFCRFTAMLATRTLEMNDRIQILSKLTLREKITTFLSCFERRTGQKTFTVPFDRAGLAVYLGVNRTALSRELSAMQREGILHYYRNSFKIMK